MRRPRVLVVDDSAAVRSLLSDILKADPEIELVGAAANAAIALSKIQSAAPDVVTLDVEMPDVNGLELLARIREVAPRLPVIMFSALTQRAAATTLEALARGASDYVTKPSGTGSREASIEQVRSQLIPKIKTLTRHLADTPPARPAPPAALRARDPAAGQVRSCPRIEVVAVASSTGGPNALAQLFQDIPQNFPLPVVVVQHMPPLFTRLLAERLSSTCHLRFKEAADGEPLRAGEVYIAPGDYHMALRREASEVRVVLNREPAENSVRPAADVLFRSVAAAYGARAMGVVLTGMGQDGLRGCELLRGAGAWIVAQNEASSVVWGMPGFVVRAGLADRVLPLSEIAAEVLLRSMKPLEARFQAALGEARRVS